MLQQLMDDRGCTEDIGHNDVGAYINGLFLILYGMDFQIGRIYWQKHSQTKARAKQTIDGEFPL